MIVSESKVNYSVDVCVVGGGLAGLFAAVSAAENGDFAPLFAQTFGKNFDHRSFTGSPAGQIADAYDLTADGMVAEKSFIVEPEPELHRHAVKSGRDKKERQKSAVASAVAPAFDEFKNRKV